MAIDRKVNVIAWHQKPRILNFNIQHMARQRLEFFSLVPNNAPDRAKADGLG
ncbi:hypothetical protein ACFOGG_05340 [Brenneria rubrifaciens]